MKIFLPILMILIFISCDKKTDKQTIIILKQIYATEIQQTINLFEKRFPLNPAKVWPFYDRAKLINREFEKIDSILNSTEKDKQQLLDYLNNIVDTYGKNRFSKDSLLNSRLNILKDVIENNKIANLDYCILFSELNCTLIKKLYDIIDENEYKFNFLQAYVVPDRTEIKVGEIYQGKVIIAAFDTTKHPIILYNNEQLPFLGKIGILSIKATSKGLKNTKGEFSISFDDKAQTIKLPFDVKYNVK